MIGNSGPADKGFAIVKSDTTEIKCRSLFIGTGGDVVVTLGGNDLTFKNVPDGFILPIAPTKVKDATTAADIIGLR